MLSNANLVDLHSRAAHTHHVLVRASRSPQIHYKTEICTLWAEHKRCPYDIECQFAHGLAELRPVRHYRLEKNHRLYEEARRFAIGAETVTETPSRDPIIFLLPAESFSTLFLR